MVCGEDSLCVFYLFLFFYLLIFMRDVFWGRIAILCIYMFVCVCVCVCLCLCRAYTITLAHTCTHVFFFFFFFFFYNLFCGGDFWVPLEREKERERECQMYKEVGVH